MLLLKEKTSSTYNEISLKNYRQKIAINATDISKHDYKSHGQGTVVFRAVRVFLYLPGHMAPSVHPGFSTTNGGQKHWNNFPGWPALRKEA